MLAIVQDYMPDNRAVGNGIFIAIAFLMQTLTVLVLGIIGDNYGLDIAYLFSALVYLLAIPIIFTIPMGENTG